MKKPTEQGPLKAVQRGRPQPGRPFYMRELGKYGGWGLGAGCLPQRKSFLFCLYNKIIPFAFFAP
jgi:hypothetical protein